MRLASKAKLCAIVLGMLLSIVPVRSALAQFTIDPNLGTTFGIGTRNVEEIVISLIQWFLGILALLAVVFILYAGFSWLSSGGNEERIKKAKLILRNAIIGLLIILSAWGIVTYLFSVFGEATGIPGQACSGEEGCEGGYQCCRGSCIPETQQCSGGPCPFCGSNDPFRIASRSPDIDEQNVPLCRAVDIAFNVPFQTNTVVNGETFKLCAENCLNNRALEGNITPWPVDSPSNKKIGFVFELSEDLKPEKSYQIVLTDEIKSQKGDPLGGDKKIWNFNTGDETDSTPPIVFFDKENQPKPFDSQTDVCRSARIKVTFSEAINPISVHSKTVFVDDSPRQGIEGNVLIGDWQFQNLFSSSGNDTFSVKSNELFSENAEYGIRLFAGSEKGAKKDQTAIRDLCGNPLDGNASSQSQGSPDDDFMTNDPNVSPSVHPIPPEKWETPWTFTTGVITECKPKITGLSPVQGPYSSEMTINGEWLEEASDFWFSPENSIFGNACFDNRFFPTESCYKGGASQILTKVPVQISSQETRTGPVTVLSGEFREPSPMDFTITSPRVIGLGPSSGPPNQFITVFGEKFGNTKGKVLFRFSDRDIEGTFPCSQSWADNRIIVKVPENLKPGEMPVVQVIHSESQRSNTKEFTVTNDPPGPGICNVIPSCVNNPMAQGIDRIEGERFGNVFGRVDIDSKTGRVQTWTDVLLSLVDVPDELKQGESPLIVYNAIKSPSNTWKFSFPCGAAPKIVNDGTCRLPDLYPSPNPRPDSKDQCRNATVAARFDQDMDMDSVLSNIALIECNVGSSFSEPDCKNPVLIDSREDPQFPKRGFLMEVQKGRHLNPGAWYQVRVGVKAMSLKGIAMGTEERWQFLSEDSESLCSPDQVLVTPQSQDLFGNHPQSAEYESKAFGKQCEIMTMNEWNWASENPLIASMKSSQKNSAVFQTVGQNPENIGSTPVTAETGAVIGSARFSYQPEGCKTNEDCKSRYCSGESRCEKGTCMPVITKLSPVETPRGGPVTIMGCHFGSQKGQNGKVTFDGVEAKFANQCGPGAWTNDEIIVTVPQGIGPSPENTKVQVTRDFDLQKSNGSNFKVSVDCQGVPIPKTGMPLLCSIEPDKEKSGNPIAFKGDRFAEQSQRNDVKFANGASPDEYSSWSENEITFTIPKDAGTGPAGAVIEGCKSNEKYFTNLDLPDPGNPGVGSQCKKSIPQFPDVCTKGVEQWDPNYGCLEDSSKRPTVCNVCCVPGTQHQTSGLQCVEVTADPTSACKSSGDPKRGLFCGCSSFSDCKPLGCGRVGQENCCVSHPQMESVNPNDGEENVCRNQAIEVVFSELMDESSISKGFQVFGPEPLGGCNEGKITKNWFQKILDMIAKKIFHQAIASHPDLSCPIRGAFDFFTRDEKTVLMFEPDKLFVEDEKYYLVSLADSDITDPIASGIKSRTGLGLNGRGEDHITTDFTVGPKDRICNPSRIQVTLTPPGSQKTSDVFSCEADDCEGDQSPDPGNQHGYHAQAVDLEGHPVQMDSYEWKETQGPEQVVELKTGMTQKDSIGTVVSRTGQEVIESIAKWKGLQGEIQLEQPVSITAAICEYPWPDPPPYEDPTFRFSTWYCKDNLSDPLDPTMDFDVQVADPGMGYGKDRVLKQIFFRQSNVFEGEVEAIGLRIMENRDLLSPKKWYEKNIPLERRGSPGSTTIDGYDAIIDGDTYYIGATNWVSGSPNKLYNNMVVFSLNQNPSPKMKIAFGQMVENFIFTLDGASQKSAIVNDTKRITRLGEIASILVDHHKETGQFPPISSGSFLEGISTSIWPSWNQTLGNQLQATLPVDPLNDFEPDCDFDPITCWNPDRKTFFCPKDSRVFQYQFQENQEESDEARLYTHMETKNAQWVRFDDSLMDQYKGKDPCSSPSSCPCFTIDNGFAVNIDDKGAQFGVPN